MSFLRRNEMNEETGELDGEVAGEVQLELPFRTAYGGRMSVRHHNSQPTMTQQHKAAATDINAIMSKYVSTGQIDHYAEYSASYGEMDGSEYLDHAFQQSNAQSMFNDLPAKIQQEFHHNPAEFLDYVHALDPDDPHAMERAFHLGITSTPPVTAGEPTQKAQAEAPTQPEPEKTEPPTE